MRGSGGLTWGRGSAGHDVLHECWKEGASEGQGSALGRRGWSLGCPCPPEDLLPSEPTFIVDAAIGVFLPSHQLLYLIFCQPLTWRGGRPSQHRPEEQRVGHIGPLCVVAWPLQYSHTSGWHGHRGSRGLGHNPHSETRRTGDKSKGQGLGCSLGSVHNSATLVFKSPVCPLLCP